MTGRAQLRSATAADAEAILALAIACDEADVGAADTDMDDIASDLAEPGCEVWVVGEPPVAYAHLAADTNAYVGVPPPACGRGIGTLIREHVEQRASEREMAKLRQAAYGANDAARAHLEAAGYAKDETWWRMRGALATLAEPPPLPGDVGLADYGGSPEEERTLYELIDAAMMAVPSNRPVPFDVWVARNTRRPGFDPGLALLARDGAGELVGAALGNRAGRRDRLRRLPRGQRRAARRGARPLAARTPHAALPRTRRRLRRPVRREHQPRRPRPVRIGRDERRLAHRRVRQGPGGVTDAAAELAALAREHGRLGLDTEFMPEGRYKPLLCLVQIAAGDRIEVFDPLDGAGFDPVPLAGVLADPAVEVILHAGRQDVAILRREWKTDITNVFDTQVAAGFAGFSAQAGYLGLLHDVLRVRLAKSASFTRWDARPLTTEQLHYAREDVEHLFALSDEIQRRLSERGRLDWAREECLAIAESSDERDPDEVWRRLPRASSLDPRERAVARALGAWRERTAAAEDRPVGAIVRDPSVIELAKRQPKDRRALSQIRGIGPEVLRRRADDVLRVIEEGRHGEPIRVDEVERTSVDAVDGPTVALAESLVRARAQEAGLAYELIAARADLVPIVVSVRRGRPEPAGVRTLQGWRRALVGEELLALLRGERTLRVGDGGRVQVA